MTSNFKDCDEYGILSVYKITNTKSYILSHRLLLDFFFVHYKSTHQLDSPVISYYMFVAGSGLNSYSYNII